LFKIRNSAKKIATKEDDVSEKNNEAYQTGLSIAKLLTSYWNSQQYPGKAFIFNRRVHHGEIGSLPGLSNLFKKSQPLSAGILSGLGVGLARMIMTIGKNGLHLRKRVKVRNPHNQCIRLEGKRRGKIGNLSPENLLAQV
jgi:hypothetical protein